MSKINRRAALTLVGATAVTGTTLAAEQPSELDTLIDAHRMAWDRFEEAVAMGETFDRTAEHRELFVSLTIGSAQSLHASRDLRETRASFQEQIAGYYKREMQGAISRLGRFAPEIGMQAQEAVRKAQANDLRAMRKVIREEQDRREAIGFAAHTREYDEACDAESDALEAVLSYRCTNAADLAKKARYAHEQLKTCIWNEWQTEALLTSLLPEGGVL